MTKLVHDAACWNQAAIMCLATGPTLGDEENSYVITGSKDHYIKVRIIAEARNIFGYIIISSQSSYKRGFTRNVLR
jgi:hypothetical protein